MATAEVVQPEQKEAPGLPDYVLDSNAVLRDTASWRYMKAPDYSKTRAVYAESEYILFAEILHHARFFPCSVVFIWYTYQQIP
jgi:hypothetical protein